MISGVTGLRCVGGIFHPFSAIPQALSQELVQSASELPRGSRYTTF